MYAIRSYYDALRVIPCADGFANEDVAGIADAHEEDEHKSFDGAFHGERRVVVRSHTPEDHVDYEDGDAPEKLVVV